MWLVFVGFAGGMQQMGIWSDLDRALLKLRFLLTERAPSQGIVVADIDARTLQEVGVWPWPRRVHADLIDRLVEAGVSEIVFDVDFSAASSEAEDARFAKSLENSEGIVSLAVFRQPAHGSSWNTDDWIVNRPIEMFLEWAWPVVVSVPVADDALIWNAIWGDDLDGESLISMASLLGGESGEPGTQFGIDYSINHDGIPRHSVIDLLEGKVDRVQLAGRKVVVGASAQELRDLFPVPVYGTIPGSDLHVLAAESVLQGRALSHGFAKVVLIVGALMIVPLFLASAKGWIFRVTAILMIAAACEATAHYVQSGNPLVLQTGAAHVFFVLAACYAVLKDVDVYKLLLRISRAETRNNKMVLDQVFNDSFDAIVVIKGDGEVCAVSDTARLLLGDHLVVGGNISGGLPETIQADVRMALRGGNAASKGEEALNETTLVTEVGETRVIEYVVTRSSLIDAEGTAEDESSGINVACLTCRDVTQKRQAEARLAYMANFDGLTGLANRRTFENNITKLLEEFEEGGRTCAVFMFSIDGLDRIVGSLGFSFGDAVKKAIANRLTELLGPGQKSGLVSDNSFSCAMMVKSAEEAARFSRRICTVMNRDLLHDGNRILISVSVGFALAGHNGREAGLLLRQSGNALSQAERAGGNTARAFSPRIDAQIHRRRALETELRRALQRDEISVMYQPLVRLSSSQIVGVESLMRWHHDEFGLVPPSEFIPIAEDSGMIDELGAWILDKAMADAKRWPQQIRLAVNISPAQFMRGGLVKTVSSALSRNGFPPGLLDLEITESLFIDETVNLDTPIKELAAMGCRFALDDFGTGYSSLGYIPRFPFSKIKIDKSFVNDVCTDKGQAAIVKSVVDLAESFDLEVVAEGIEEPEQQSRLLSLGCTIGQGYLFGRPMRNSDLIDLLRNAA